MKNLILLCLGLLPLAGARAQETELDRAWLAAERDTSRAVAFYSEFVYALLYVPVDDSGAPVSAAGNAAPIRPLFREEDDTRYAFAFDTPERLQAWAGGAAPYKAVAGYSLVETMAADYPDVPLALNSATPFRRDFPPRELAWLHESLKSAQDPATVARDTEVYVGAPAYDAPDALLTALVEALHAQPTVRAAYLSQFEMARGRYGFLLALDLDADGRLPGIRAGIGQSVEAELPEGTALSIGAVTKRGLTEHARETGRLIYARASGR